MEDASGVRKRKKEMMPKLHQTFVVDQFSGLAGSSPLQSTRSGSAVVSAPFSLLSSVLKPLFRFGSVLEFFRLEQCILHKSSSCPFALHSGVERLPLLRWCPDMLCWGKHCWGSGCDAYVQTEAIGPIAHGPGGVAGDQ